MTVTNLVFPAFKQPAHEVSLRQMTRHMIDEPVNGRLIASCPGPTQNSWLYFWAVNGHVVICQLWSEGGWTHYLQGKAHTLRDTVVEIIATTRAEQ